FLFVFFFSSRRRHTRFSRDWSSDVCSSDLMTRQAAPAEQEYIEAKTVAAELWVLLNKKLGSAGDTLSLAQRHRLQCLPFLLPALHLHEDNDVSACGNEIDFTQARTPAAGQNPIALQSQPPGRQALCPAAPVIGR